MCNGSLNTRIHFSIIPTSKSEESGPFKLQVKLKGQAKSWVERIFYLRVFDMYLTGIKGLFWKRKKEDFSIKIFDPFFQG